MKRRIAVIPAYEPDEHLLVTVRGLISASVSVVVVDDGSGEEYAEVFRQLPANVHLITYDTNRGKGYALKKGFEFIYDKYGEKCIVVTVDSDGQHGIFDVINVLNAAEKSPEKLILGSRYMDKNAPLRSRIGNGITRAVYRVATGVRVYDTQTGLRAFAGENLNWMLNISGERYEYEMNVLLDCAKKKIQVKEVRIETIYMSNNSTSHFNVIRDSFLIYKDILKFSISSFVSFLIDYILYSLFFSWCEELDIAQRLLIANVGARVISSGVNFFINKRYVFKSQKNVFYAAMEYYLLVVFILIGNTVVLEVVANYLGINHLVAKIFIEVLFFVMSWFIQKKCIFSR